MDTVSRAGTRAMNAIADMGQVQAQIARDLLYVARLRREASELSMPSLAWKFELSEREVWNILYNGTPHEDATDIIACHKERVRLLEESRAFSKTAIKARYRVGDSTVKNVATQLGL